MKKTVAALKAAFKFIWDFVMHLFEVDFIGKAAQTAFFWLLSFFPLLLFASAALSRLEITPNWTSGIIPDEITDLLKDAKIPDFSSPLLFVASAWAASAGIWALMRAVNEVYTRKRLSSIWARLSAMIYTVGFVAVLALTLTTLVTGEWLAQLGSGIAVFALICSLYYFTPGTRARFARCAWTSAVAAAGWLAVSRGFEIYLRQFANYTVVYGSIGAFLGLALWLLLICAVIVACAEMCGYDPKKGSK